MSNALTPQPKLIPPGTQVVTGVEVKGSSGKMIHPKGAVGVVVRVQPQGLYLVRFLDGYEATLPATMPITILASPAPNGGCSTRSSPTGSSPFSIPIESFSPAST